MSEMTAEQRGDMVDALMPEAAGLVVEVHEGSAQDIKQRLAGLSRHELEGLAVVLAAMVDPDQSMRDALAWVDFDEHGRPLQGKPRGGRSVRDFQSRQVDRNQGIDVVAVQRALDGTPSTRPRLTTGERRLAIQLGVRRGMSYQDVAERLEMEVDAVERTWERIKERAREQGTRVPAAGDQGLVLVETTMTMQQMGQAA